MKAGGMDAAKKAKVQLELSLARDMKDKKGFFKCMSSKRKTSENVGPLLNEVGALLTKGTKKAELLNTFFASTFTAKASLQESQTLEARQKVERKLLLSCGRSGEKSFRQTYSQIYGLDGMHP